MLGGGQKLPIKQVSETKSAHRRLATAELTLSAAPEPRAARVRGYVRLDHVVVGGVEDVASHHPHDALVHHRLVGRSGQAGRGEVLAGPEGGVGGDGDGAVGTWRGKKRCWFSCVSNRKSEARARDSTVTSSGV